MKEITTMPVRVTTTEDDMEVYEYAEGFAMTTEFLGMGVGFKDPKVQMSRLLKKHREALEPHQFVVFKGDKLGENKLPLKATYSDRGRPSFFYDLRGCEKVAAFARTEKANVFYNRVSELRVKLEAKRIERIERYWFGKRPYWPEIRERVMLGQSFRVIAEAMGRSTASVRNAVSRMIEVGILQPMRAVQALTGTARNAVIRYHRKFSADRQPMLPGF